MEMSDTERTPGAAAEGAVNGMMDVEEDAGRVKTEENGRGEQQEAPTAAVKVEEPIGDFGASGAPAGPLQTHTIVLPSYSTWFDLGSVNTIEKESLPDFFDGNNKSKSPEIYTQYRNFMVNTYRVNPNEYLSFTAVRRNLVGDAGAVLRIFKFLNKWGLINYQVNAESRPTGVQPASTGEYVVDLDTPRGMFPFESFKPSLEFADVSKFKRALEDASESKVSEGPQGPQGPEATEDGPPRKIIRPDINAGWCEDSLAKLVEGVAQHRGDWYAVAKHVGKSPEECIVRFLKLPMEDKFLEDNRHLLGPLKYLPSLNFSTNDNPIMSTLAFLVKLVDPEVAAAAAGRAISAVDKLATDTSHEPPNEPLTHVKTASHTMLGIVGARAHAFANYEAREMNKSLTAILQLQMKTVDLKLRKLDKLEAQFQYKEKEFNRRAEDLVQEKLSMFKYTAAASNKLLNAIAILDAAQGPEDVARAKTLIAQARDVAYKPPKTHMNVLGQGTGAPEDSERGELGDSVRPVSLEAPMQYRYWSG